LLFEQLKKPRVASLRLPDAFTEISEWLAPVCVNGFLRNQWMKSPEFAVRYLNKEGDPILKLNLMIEIRHELNLRIRKKPKTG
jgi:hypothetical protein